MTRTIEVVVSPKGEVQVQTKGFVGSSCQQASKSLEEALGIKGREQMTGEFFAAVDQVRQETQTGS